MFLSLKKHSFIALIYFFIAASLGVILRLFVSIDIPVTYKHILHTHSHIALLGWVYVAFTTLIYQLFLKNSAKKKYQQIFWFTQLTILGMLCTFPFQGYALFSIIFSTLFLIASYWFLHFFLKNTSSKIKQKNSYKLIKTALWFMVFSSIGPWVLGIIMNTLGNTSIWYKVAIFFYLHFQYNGWFILAGIGLFLYTLEEQKIQFQKQEFTLFYNLLIASVFFTFFLSILWTKPATIFYILAALGNLLQLTAFLKFIQIIQKHRTAIFAVFEGSKLKTFVFKLLKLAFYLLLIKIILQTISSIPFIANLAYQQINFVIGYLHLIFLGIITISLLAFLSYFKLISFSKTGFTLFIAGFVLSEALIFYKGFSSSLHFKGLSNYYVLLTFFSALMAIGIGFFIFKSSKKLLTTN